MREKKREIDDNGKDDDKIIYIEGGGRQGGCKGGKDKRETSKIVGGETDNDARLERKDSQGCPSQQT